MNAPLLPDFILASISQLELISTRATAAKSAVLTADGLQRAKQLFENISARFYRLTQRLTNAWARRREG